MRFSRFAILIAGALAMALWLRPASADDAKPDAGADAMLQQIKDFKAPKFDSQKREDEAYVKAYVEQRKAWAAQRAEMEGKFLAAYPDHSKAGAMRMERWELLSSAEQTDKAQSECEAFLKQPGHAQDADAQYFLAEVLLDKNDAAKSQAAIDAFASAHPTDQRGAQLLEQLAESDGITPEKAKPLFQRILKDYPDDKNAKMAAGGHLRRIDELGKSFELTFTDAISGKPITMSDLKGKVVVVDFWATWCGPCVGEMPNMKKIYADNKPKGVEFIGVSLDQPEAAGGLSKLKEFVAKNEIGWPQYYQGKGWESEFSGSWGVNSIPCVFVVDANGNLASTSARGQLEKLLPELIAKRDNKSADAGQ